MSALSIMDSLLNPATNATIFELFTCSPARAIEIAEEFKKMEIPKHDADSQKFLLDKADSAISRLSVPNKIHSKFFSTH